MTFNYAQSIRSSNWFAMINELSAYDDDAVNIMAKLVWYALGTSSSNNTCAVNIMYNRFVMLMEREHRIMVVQSI